MIYEKIKEICEKKSISIYRLEKDLGFASSTVVKWKKSVPSVEKIKAIADYLGVTIEELLKADEEVR